MLAFAVHNIDDYIYLKTLIFITFDQLVLLYNWPSLPCIVNACLKNMIVQLFQDFLEAVFTILLPFDVRDNLILTFNVY